MIRRGMDWDKTLTFTVPMHGEARYRFDYLTSTYDSKMVRLRNSHFKNI